MRRRPGVRSLIGGVARASRQLGVDAGRRARGRAASVGPAARIALHDRKAAVLYARMAAPVRRSLGVEEEGWYARLVLAGAAADPVVGRRLARDVPTHLAQVPFADRLLYVELVEWTIAERPAAAAVVARTAPPIIAQMAPLAARRFVAEGIRQFETSARHAESFLRWESRAGQEEADALLRGVPLERVERVLALYARAHCGEDLVIRPIAPGGRGYVDGRTVHLPVHVAEYGDERDFLVYRVMTARCAAYLEFGTFDLDPLEVIAGFTNRSLARDLLQLVEDARVEGRVRDEYPGVARDIDRLRTEPSRPRPPFDELSPVDQVVEALLRVTQGLAMDEVDIATRDAIDPVLPRLAEVTGPEATVHDVVEALPVFYGVAAARFRRSEPPEVPPEPEPDREPAERPDGPDAMPDVPPSGDEVGSGGADDYDGVVLPPGAAGLAPDDWTRAVRDLAREIRELESQVGERRPTSPRRPGDAEDREAAARLAENAHPGGALVDGDASSGGPTGAATGSAAEPADGAILYPEWDCAIRDVKPDWTRVVEHRLTAGEPGFVERVRDQHAHLIHRLRRSFEALRPDHTRRQRALLDGDELDIDAAVEARTTLRVGGSPSDRIYARRVPGVRDVAAAFLVDLSSSTNEVVNVDGQRIIDVEKEALACVAEALDALGDRFAIYGFSGYGRRQVDFFVAKEFREPLTEGVRERIGGLAWRMENRDGAAIRHCTAKLLDEPARVRILFLLSDGRPLDCGCEHYFDRYAQEDTRAALQEARARGVHPFCITVDPHGADYLEAMYGEGSYTVVERVSALPQRLPALYRRLTR